MTKQPGTCIHCHGSVYVPYKKMGGGDLIKGFEMMNQLPFVEARKRVEHPVACIDCHDPATMQLRVTRPGFLEGIKLVKAKAGWRTTTSTPWRHVRRCVRTCAGNATSSTTSRDRRSA